MIKDKYNFIPQPLYTPCYIIDLQKFNENVTCITSEFKKEWGNNIGFGYSIKTNHLPFLLQYAKSSGFLAEAVSSDEYYFALSQGFNCENIILNGPKKDEKTLLNALNEGSIVNIDNFEDLEIIKRNINLINKERCVIGIRVNFDLEKICPRETTLGREVSRFGICIENGDFEKALDILRTLGLKVHGLHMHYSTKTRSIAVFKALANKAADLILKYKMADSLTFVDIGGGLRERRQLPGKPTMKDYSKVICNQLKNAVSPDKVQLILEPGVSIHATAIDYLCRVINVRVIRDTTIGTVDGSLLHISPYMVTKQFAFSTNSSTALKIPKQIICGSTCVEKDRLLYLQNYNEFQNDDLITFHYVGAYTICKNNCFINCPPRIYIKDNDKYCCVRDKSLDLMSQI